MLVKMGQTRLSWKTASELLSCGARVALALSAISPPTLSRRPSACDDVAGFTGCTGCVCPGVSGHVWEETQPLQDKSVGYIEREF